MKPELLKRIQEYFNLNIYETKVWLALLNKGSATAGEVAEMSDVPRSRTYDVLESLEKQGFAVMKLGKPIKYMAVNPSIVLDRMKSNVTKEAEEKQKFLETIKDNNDYKQLLLIHKQGVLPIQPEDVSSMIKGRPNLHNHMKNFLLNASKQVIMATTSSALTKKKWLKSISESLHRKGVDFKLMVNGNESEVKDLLSTIKADVKFSNISSRFCIVDNKEMLFMLTPDSTNEQYDCGIWINSPFFVSAISSLFNTAWKTKE